MFLIKYQFSMKLNMPIISDAKKWLCSIFVGSMTTDQYKKLHPTKKRAKEFRL